ncbi:MAG: hypothetical protein NMK33_03195 [Candidatus Cardinium sp.]|uniref:hypothetical protein n=1 Tax=Cardinium endosymbiont of Dermatophagoides farinae TaxID=2597823 RepID=UPI001182B3E5|nr:hypothetical protein [Cardinium endosymbiont of Dermatophagoides farinae]TSJ81474.1 hypothetical protein FPG78_05895 [Cardinium endosymbiont of Dermatophagoides farinae]UWW96451.1 MAG: hypothetical protein NMK33_03195 [Candidatus Cardinium sp.]
MSNHSGSYQLNDVLILLDSYQFFETLEKEKILSLIKGIQKIGEEYDSNNGEILDGIGKKLGICYYYIEFADQMDDYGICTKCNGLKK